jgi:hypothetical protein
MLQALKIQTGKRIFKNSCEIAGGFLGATKPRCAPNQLETISALDLPAAFGKLAPVNFNRWQFASRCAAWYYFTKAAGWCLRRF